MNLAQEKMKMEQFFEKVSDEELVAILRDLDWQHYAECFSAPRLLTSQYLVSVKTLPTTPPKAWDVRHWSVLNEPNQERLAA